MSNEYTQCIFLKGIYLTQEGYAKWYVAHQWNVRKVADNMQLFEIRRYDWKCMM